MTLLKKEAVYLGAELDNAIDAITLSGELLVSAGYAKKEYTDAMIKGFNDVGPYIVIAPGIAIPHSRPEKGALKTGFSLVRLKDPINFGHDKNDPVQLVCAITGTGNNGHIEMLQKIAIILGDREKHKQILEAKNFGDIAQIITI
ncbi:PTS sugar transporter subunit IIA [Bacillaceae bacterium S4-13-56]